MELLVAHKSLSPGAHFPNQPSLSTGSTESNSLTLWWGATLCTPELNDVAPGENVVTAVRIAAMSELVLNVEIAKPTVQSIRSLMERKWYLQWSQLRTQT